jgi:arginine decarboxylase-like protein
MANELENAIKKAAVKIAQYVEDVAKLTVETRYVEVGSGQATDYDQARPLASTLITLDGDNHSVVPMQRTKEGALELDSTLYEIHQDNVATAIAYRTEMMQALLGMLQRSPDKD